MAIAATFVAIAVLIVVWVALSGDAFKNDEYYQQSFPATYQTPLTNYEVLSTWDAPNGEILEVLGSPKRAGWRCSCGRHAPPARRCDEQKALAAAHKHLQDIHYARYS